MSEKQKLTEYQIRELTGRVSYVSGAKRDLVSAALRVLQEKHSGLSEAHTKEMLRDLANAGLISDGAVKSLLSKIF
ncbi:hypothetical protein HON52_02325 [Candidatus Uhrbacteria bacterium]|jgi:hypothetical protein|nr:hypothetical protein [Candidatus Uhrbacteria bacterium]